MKRILIALLLLCLLMPGALAQESAKKEPLTLRVYLYDPAAAARPRTRAAGTARSSPRCWIG